MCLSLPTDEPQLMLTQGPAMMPPQAAYPGAVYPGAPYPGAVPGVVPGAGVMPGYGMPM